jgi:hypothetical protein
VAHLLRGLPAGYADQLVAEKFTAIDEKLFQRF